MADEYIADGVPFLRSQNVLPFQVSTADVKFISRSFHERLQKSALRPRDVVVVRTGYPGTAAVIPKWLADANCADLVVITPGPDLDCDYLAAVFNSTWGAGSVAGALVGSAQQHFNIGAARKMRLHLPPMPTQRKIAAVLTAYDELIENNNRRIMILEEMARRIYHEWFVEFRYPGHEDVPLLPSPIGPIPAEWRLVRLGELATVDKGISYSGAFLTAEGPPMANLKCFWPQGGFRREGTKPYSGPVKDKHRIVPGDIIIANTDVTQAGNIIGAPALVPRLGFEAGGIISHHLFAVRPRGHGIGKVLFFLALLHSRFRNFARANASGTTVLGFRSADCANYQILVPQAKLCEHAERILEPLIKASEVMRDEVTLLAAARDVLLPRLISGAIDVADPDIVPPSTAS